MILRILFTIVTLHLAAFVALMINQNQNNHSLPTVIGISSFFVTLFTILLCLIWMDND